MTVWKAKRKTTMAIAALLLLCAALAACTLSITPKITETPEPSATKDPVEDEPGDSIKALGWEDMDRLEVGEEALIYLHENPSTGYRWYYEITGNGVVELVSDRYISDPNPKGWDGVGGSRYITIKAVTPGEASIEMICKRADDEIAETRAYPIVVTAGQRSTALLYADYSLGEAGGDIRTQELIYEGELTVEKLAAGLSGWSKLDFSVSAVIDGKAVIVDWLKASALTGGTVGGEPDTGFSFPDGESLSWFMLDSLWRTVYENLGLEVYYTMDGGKTLTLPALSYPASFPADIPYLRSPFYVTHSDAYGDAPEPQYYGGWHASPTVGSGFNTRYRFDPDGSFIYCCSDMDGMDRNRGADGKWSIKPISTANPQNELLCLEISTRIVWEGGIEVESFGPTSQHGNGPV